MAMKNPPASAQQAMSKAGARRPARLRANYKGKKTAAYAGDNNYGKPAHAGSAASATYKKPSKTKTRNK